MKLQVIRDAACREAEVTLRYAPEDRSARRLLQYLRQFSLPLEGWDGEERRLVPARDIFYLETVDRKTFLYLERTVLQSRESLVALERRLEGTAFARVSKQCLLNTEHLRGVRALINHRMEAELKNGERVLVSRAYRTKLREKIQSLVPPPNQDQEHSGCDRERQGGIWEGPEESAEFGSNQRGGIL